MHDAIIIGSGATGAWAAMALTRRGLRVLVLESGPERALGADVGPAAYGPPPLPGAAPLPARQPVQGRHPAFHEGNRHLFVDDVAQPYSTPSDRPFDWIRGEQVGGRSLTWARVTLRLSRHELDATAADDAPGAWPIGYDDLAPHYGVVERFMRVHGHPDGLGQLPDGEFLPAFPLTPAEARLRAEVEAAWPERRVIAARGVPVPDRFDEWPSFTAQAMLAEATRTGRLELRTGCAAHEILVDPREGLARGVRYLHLGKGEEREAPAGLVLVGASTVGTLRLLLSSGGAFAPAGLGNENGLLGRGLMDHVSFAMLGEVPDPPASPPPPFGGPHGVLLPRFRNLAGQRPDYVGGFGYWGGAGRAFGGSRFLFVGYGEVLPRPDNAVTLDASRRDAAGRPLAHVAMSWGDNERAMMRDARDCLREMLERAGMRLTHESDALQVPGRFVHETGGAPMGETPRASVLDPENRLWSVPNVLVVDGACFPRCGYQNPTLTMLALCDRACDRLVARLARGERRARPGGRG